MILRSIDVRAWIRRWTLLAVEGLRMLFILNADYDLADASDVNCDDVLSGAGRVIVRS